MQAIRTEKLSKIYGSGGSKVVGVDDVNIEVKEGEFVAIVGPSGGGKSTLLHLIGGIVQPSSGRVFINGKDLMMMSEEERTIFRRRSIGFVFQSYNLVPILTGYENIELPLDLDGENWSAHLLMKWLKSLRYLISWINFLLRCPVENSRGWPC